MNGARTCPSQVRFRVLAMTVTLSFITYPDRVCVSITAPQIMRDLSLKSMQMSFVSSAFTATCAFFKITVGWRGRAS